jgi:hypothetical protein
MPSQLATRPTPVDADTSRHGRTAAPELAGLLRDGTAVWVRPLVAADRAWYGEFINHLSQPSRYSRFFETWTTIPANLLDWLVDVDGIDHIALVGLIAADGATPPPSWPDPASLPVGSRPTGTQRHLRLRRRNRLRSRRRTARSRNRPACSSTHSSAELAHSDSRRSPPTF